MTFKLDSRYIGYPPIESFVPTLALSGLPASTPWPPIPEGLIVEAEDPVWGAGEFIFAKANGTIPIRAICQLLPTWNSTTRKFDWMAVALANTANVGRPCAVCVAEQGAAGAVNALTTGQWGWFMLTGNTPINGTASVAAGTTVGITAAGQIGANSAGKQILNAVSAAPATQTVVVASVRGDSGSDLIQVANVDGLFVGGYISGTGVGAASIIKSIDRMGMVIQSSVVNSAAVSGNITQTANNATIFYNVVHLDRPFVQGAIT